MWAFSSGLQRIRDECNYTFHGFLIRPADCESELRFRPLPCWRSPLIQRGFVPSLRAFRVKWAVPSAGCRMTPSKCCKSHMFTHGWFRRSCYFHLYSFKTHRAGLVVACSQSSCCRAIEIQVRGSIETDQIVFWGQQPSLQGSRLSLTYHLGRTAGWIHTSWAEPKPVTWICTGKVQSTGLALVYYFSMRGIRLWNPLPARVEKQDKYHKMKSTCRCCDSSHLFARSKPCRGFHGWTKKKNSEHMILELQ